MKKDHEREQEKNNKYFFYQSKYTRLEKLYTRDRENLNFNSLQSHINQAFDEYNFRSNFQSNIYFSFFILFRISISYDIY